MPPPYDTVISIGGQSLVDGVWRLLGPALEGLSNPLPLALPGFSNASMRVTRLTPVFPGTPPPTGGAALEVLVNVELNAEALLNVNVATESISISLGPQQLNLTSLTGTIDLPTLTGNLTNLNISGNTNPVGSSTTLLNDIDLGPGTGTLNLPASTANLTNGNLTGTLNLTLPRVPLPAVVPVAVDLTPSAPLVVSALLQLTVRGIDPTTRFGLLIEVGNPSVGAVALDPALAAMLTTSLQSAVNQIVQQLGIPNVITQSPVNAATVSALLAPLANVVRAALTDALRSLLAATGRLIYPPAGAGASCDVQVLPTVADASLAVAGGAYVLQIGFRRPSSTDIATLPPFAPAGIADSTLLVGNRFLLELLCCLVQRLPGFTFPVAASNATTDVTGASHLMCCNLNGATVNLGPVALNGGLSVCIDGSSGSPKSITLVGGFGQGAPVGSLPLATIDVRFTLPLTFDLDDVASLANLRVSGSPAVSVAVSPNPWLVFIIAIGGLLLIGPAVAVVANALLLASCIMASRLLDSAVRTVLGAASLVRSPVSIPPGVFEAFGKLVPVTVTIDDLTAHSVLQTPTSPWAVLPRIGRDRPSKPDSVD
ncbi:MAG TPA: hypothetical protein VF240_16030 [Pyrinomonadaceae bacterium]